jgi:hypothetical protein
MNPNPGAGTPVRCWLLALTALAGGCFSHTVQSAPIEIKPIHITMDINLRVQKELDEFFDFEERTETPSTASTETNGKE